ERERLAEGGARLVVTSGRRVCEAAGHCDGIRVRAPDRGEAVEPLLRPWHAGIHRECLAVAGFGRESAPSRLLTARSVDERERLVQSPGTCNARGSRRMIRLD